MKLAATVNEIAAGIFRDVARDLEASGRERVLTALEAENARLKERVRMLESANTSMVESRDIVRGIIGKLVECGRVKEV